MARFVIAGYACPSRRAEDRIQKNIAISTNACPDAWICGNAIDQRYSVSRSRPDGPLIKIRHFRDIYILSEAWHGWVCAENNDGYFAAMHAPDALTSVFSSETLTGLTS